MAKLKIYGTESYSTFVVKEPIEIDTDDYPELKGKTEAEIKDYIRDNAEEMKPVIKEYYDNLWDELMGSDVRREKIYGEDMGITFDGE